MQEKSVHFSVLNSYLKTFFSFLNTDFSEKNYFLQNKWRSWEESLLKDYLLDRLRDFFKKIHETFFLWIPFVSLPLDELKIKKITVSLIYQFFVFQESLSFEQGFLARERNTLHRMKLLKHPFQIKGPFSLENFVTRSVVSSASSRSGPIFRESIRQRFRYVILRRPWLTFWGEEVGRLPPGDPPDTPARAWWWCVIAGMRACVNVDTSSPLMNKGWSVMRDTRHRVYRDRRWRLEEVPLAWHRWLTLFLHLGDGKPGCRWWWGQRREREIHSPTGGSKQGQALYLSLLLILPFLFSTSTRSSKTSWPLSWSTIGRCKYKEDSRKISRIAVVFGDE